MSNGYKANLSVPIPNKDEERMKAVEAAIELIHADVGSGKFSSPLAVHLEELSSYADAIEKALKTS